LKKMPEDEKICYVHGLALLQESGERRMKENG
jgi:hypothetical protein